MPLPPFLISICLIAISSDFLDMFLPKPLLSVGDGLTGFRRDGSGKCATLRDSIASFPPLVLWTRLLPLGSTCLPLEVIGDEFLLGTLLLAVLLEVGVSTCTFTVRAAPGLDLPAEIGLSGRVVRRFGGVSSEKSGGTTG
jgi:hypothetical protein